MFTLRWLVFVLIASSFMYGIYGLSWLAASYGIQVLR